ncbi:MutS-related protein [Fervidobacterium thailandense]|uniref:DNA mismatch repair proteins mutS family domain-containing protein n=1 Tax=Fervidobacterium thailandense TaxID=1008305 RepID=A0A1E3G4H5_9BACT|nr:hypothetical protein [Fervidobacterium thailandense]ODN30548.1 hypothetical protein A4H02_04685 [Fervidobacterium thailandense]
MSKLSLLYKHGVGEVMHVPSDSIRDLMIEELIEEILRNDYQKGIAKKWYLQPLRDVDNVRYRQEIFDDLMKDRTLLEGLKSFVEKMEDVHRLLRMTRELTYDTNKKGWFLEAALRYCKTVEALSGLLEGSKFDSSGLMNLREYVTNYVASEKFRVLKFEAEQLKKELSSLKYVLILQPGQVTVKEYEDEEEYASAIEKTFEKFKQAECDEKYRFDLRKATGMNHVEARIVEFLRTIYPETFQMLDNFYTRHADFLDDTIDSVAKELIFYTSYLSFLQQLKERGLPFAIPRVSTTEREEIVLNTFDPLLALKSGKHVVQNDVNLERAERFMIITGPNQGGKTTYARLYGLLHYLAGLGLPIPASRAKLFLPDGIYTHFERKEEVESQKSKLEDDLIRLKSILENVTQNSVVILNEIFSSAALYDATILGKELLKKLIDIDCYVAWVTFIDELAEVEHEKIVSMVALVSPEDPSIRTFKIERRKVKGRAHAISIARKYGLTYDDVKRRFSNESSVAERRVS